MKIVKSIELKGKVHETLLLDELYKYGINHDPSMSMGLNVKMKRREIDAVWKTGDFTYIIEAKPELNFEAIGQVLVYEYLYKKRHPEEKTKKGIICKEAIEQEFLSFCLEKDITVFALTENGIYEHKPNAV